MQSFIWAAGWREGHFYFYLDANDLGKAPQQLWSAELRAKTGLDIRSCIRVIETLSNYPKERLTVRPPVSLSPACLADVPSESRLRDRVSSWIMSSNPSLEHPSGKGDITDDNKPMNDDKHIDVSEDCRSFYSGSIASGEDSKPRGTSGWTRSDHQAHFSEHIAAWLKETTDRSSSGNWTQ